MNNQCWHDGTCAELERDLIYHARVEPTEAVKFRYILDIDGWGWSSRFRRELTTGSVLFKATIYVGLPSPPPPFLSFQC